MVKDLVNQVYVENQLMTYCGQRVADLKLKLEKVNYHQQQQHREVDIFRFRLLKLIKKAAEVILLKFFMLINLYSPILDQELAL